MKARTERLTLRTWQESDHAPFAQLNSNKDVMLHFPKTLSLKQSNDFIKKINKHFAEHGFGLYAIELKKTGDFIGFTGLNIPKFFAHFTPCVEIGWRIDSKFWNNGYATEAAKKLLQLGFDEFNLKEIVSFTTKNNLASQKLMQKIGMTYNKKDDFMHPNLKKNHPLAPHMLYRIQNSN